MGVNPSESTILVNIKVFGKTYSEIAGSIDRARLSAQSMSSRIPNEMEKRNGMQ